MQFISPRHFTHAGPASLAVLLCTFVALIQLTTPAFGARVEAFASPQQVMVGESAQYTLRFHDSSNLPNILAPRVDGIDFANNPSTSSRTEIINGVVSRFSELSWSFRAVREGNFTIPGRSVRVSGQEIEIPAVAVRVVPQSEEAQSRAFLILETDPAPYFTGQIVPAKVQLLIRRDLSLGGADFPAVNDPAFQVMGLSKQPQQSTVRYNGLIYNALVWEFHWSPIRSGEFNLQVFQNINLQITENNARSNSFFGFGRTRTEPMSLRSELVPVTVQPVPRDDRPSSFRDAVGDLEVSSSWSSRDLTLGEPVTFTLSLSGTANFDRISAPELPEWDNWRAYPPRSQFSATDEDGLRGTKSFEYILMPLSESVTELPAFEYSTFDPETGEFVTTRFAAEPVEVKPALTSGGSSAVVFGDRNETTGPAAAQPSTIPPLHTELGTSGSFGSGSLASPLFWGVNSGIGGSVAALLAVLYLRNRRRDDLRWQKLDHGNRKIRELLKSASKAAAAGDAASYHSCARSIIQERVNQLGHGQSESSSLVSSDCRDLLEAAKTPPDAVETALGILNAADTFHFAPAGTSGGDLSVSLRTLEDVLRKLPDSSR